MPQYMRQGYGKMLIDFSEYSHYLVVSLPDLSVTLCLVLVSL